MNMDTNDKIITLASFVYLDKVNSFKSYLGKRFKIKRIIYFNIHLTKKIKRY